MSDEGLFAAFVLVSVGLALAAIGDTWARGRHAALVLRIGEDAAWEAEALALARWCARLSAPVGALGWFAAIVAALFSAFAVAHAVGRGGQWTEVAALFAAALGAITSATFIVLGRSRIHEGIARDRARVLTGIGLCVLGNAAAIGGIYGYAVLDRASAASGGGPPLAEMLLGLLPCAVLPGIPALLGCYALIVHGPRYRAMGRPWKGVGSRPHES